jgi:cephalosporin-C deacetylase-like acetyl esterase
MWVDNQLAVQTDSQIGLLAFVASAPDPRVTQAIASYPAVSDVTGYLHGRAGCWPVDTRP